MEVLHFDHALRGEASSADACFVAEVSASLGLPCHVGRADWDTAIENVTEEQARSARFRFFSEACRRRDIAPFDVVTGHHASDVVETMLMRLARGSGMQGLCAPRSVSMATREIRCYRPLLHWESSRIRAALEGCGIPWREDASNQQGTHHRNRLRQKVIPAWQAASDRPIWAGVARSRRLLEEDWRALEGLADRLWAEWRLLSDNQPNRFERAYLKAQPLALQRRLLQRALGAVAGATASASLEEDILGAIAQNAPGSFALSPHYRIELEPKWLQLVEATRERESRPFCFRLPIGARAYLPNGKAIGCELVTVTGGLDAFLRRGGCDDNTRIYVKPLGKQSAALSVRQRQAGDAFKPKGKSSPKKLNDLLVERKVKVGERDQLPVVTDDMGRIIWVPGVPPASDSILGAEDRLALQLTYL